MKRASLFVVLCLAVIVSPSRSAEPIAVDRAASLESALTRRPEILSAGLRKGLLSNHTTSRSKGGEKNPIPGGRGSNDP